MSKALTAQHMSSISMLALLCASAFSGASLAQNLSAQDKLSAIRKELVQAALEAPTHVQATQWIDSQGVLRESSSFRSGMQIRGIRVLSYGQDEQGEPSAKLEWKVPPPQAGAAVLAQLGTAEHSKLCKPSEPPRLHHVASLSWSTGSGWNADELPLLQDIKSIFSADLQRASANSALWRLSETDSETESSSYYQALLSTGSDNIPWKITLALQPLPSATTGWQMLRVLDPEQRTSVTVFDPGGKHEPLRLGLQMTLAARQQSRPVVQLNATLALERQSNNWEPTRLEQGARQLVSQQALAWAQEIQGVLACLPVLAQVTQATPGQVRINVGSQAGVRVGDDWLLADGQKIPQRLLETDLASHTVLAKVQFIDKYQAQLQIQAGANAVVRRHWTAWAAQ